MAVDIVKIQRFIDFWKKQWKSEEDIQMALEKAKWEWVFWYEDEVIWWQAEVKGFKNKTPWLLESMWDTISQAPWNIYDWLKQVPSSVVWIWQEMLKTPWQMYDTLSEIPWQFKTIWKNIGSEAYNMATDYSRLWRWEEAKSLIWRTAERFDVLWWKLKQSDDLYWKEEFDWWISGFLKNTLNLPTINKKKFVDMWLTAWAMSDTIWDVFISWIKGMSSEEMKKNFKKWMEEVIKTDWVQKLVKDLQKLQEWHELLKKYNPQKALEYESMYWALSLAWDLIDLAWLWKTEKGAKWLIKNTAKNINKQKLVKSSILKKEIKIPWTEILKKAKNKILPSGRKKEISNLNKAFTPLQRVRKWVVVRDQKKIDKQWGKILDDFSKRKETPQNMKEFQEWIKRWQKDIYKIINPALEKNKTKINLSDIIWDAVKKVSQNIDLIYPDETNKIRQFLKRLKWSKEHKNIGMSELENFKQDLNASIDWNAKGKDKVFNKFLKDFANDIWDLQNDILWELEWTDLDLRGLKNTYWAYSDMLYDVNKAVIKYERKKPIWLFSWLWRIAWLWNLWSWVLKWDTKQVIKWWAQLITWEVINSMNDANNIIKRTFKKKIKKIKPKWNIIKIKPEPNIEKTIKPKISKKEIIKNRVSRNKKYTKLDEEKLMKEEIKPDNNLLRKKLADIRGKEIKKIENNTKVKSKANKGPTNDLKKKNDITIIKDKKTLQKENKKEIVKKSIKKIKKRIKRLKFQKDLEKIKLPKNHEWTIAIKEMRQLDNDIQKLKQKVYNWEMSEKEFMKLKNNLISKYNQKGINRQKKINNWAKKLINSLVKYLELWKQRGVGRNKDKIKKAIKEYYELWWDLSSLVREARNIKTDTNVKILLDFVKRRNKYNGKKILYWEDSGWYIKEAWLFNDFYNLKLKQKYWKETITINRHLWDLFERGGWANYIIEKDKVLKKEVIKKRIKGEYIYDKNKSAIENALLKKQFTKKYKDIWERISWSKKELAGLRKLNWETKRPKIEIIKIRKRLKKWDKPTIHTFWKIADWEIIRNWKPLFKKWEKVNPSILKNDYWFNSIEYWNYVDDIASNYVIKRVAEWLSDLEDVIWLDLKKINKTSKLNIWLWSRGGGRASAHYNNLNNLIHLTKSKWDWSLAHEYLHFLDRYFWNISSIDEIKDKWLKKIMEGLYKDIKKGDYYNKSMLLWQYWIKDKELLARAFESYVFWKLLKKNKFSKFLVHNTDIKWLKYWIFPIWKQADEISDWFDKLFNYLKKNDWLWNKIKKVKPSNVGSIDTWVEKLWEIKNDLIGLGNIVDDKAFNIELRRLKSKYKDYDLDDLVIKMMEWHSRVWLNRIVKFRQNNIKIAEDFVEWLKRIKKEIHNKGVLFDFRTAVYSIKKDILLWNITKAKKDIKRLIDFSYSHRLTGDNISKFWKEFNKPSKPLRENLIEAIKRKKTKELDDINKISKNKISENKRAYLKEKINKLFNSKINKNTYKAWWEEIVAGLNLDLKLINKVQTKIKEFIDKYWKRAKNYLWELVDDIADIIWIRSKFTWWKKKTIKDVIKKRINKPKLETTHPLWWIYKEYNPNSRVIPIIDNKNIRTSDSILWWKPSDEITIYRWLDKKYNKINNWDFVSDEYRVAESYAWNWHIVSKKVKKGDLIYDEWTWDLKEFIYRKGASEELKKQWWFSFLESTQSKNIIEDIRGWVIDNKTFEWFFKIYGVWENKKQFKQLWDKAKSYKTKPVMTERLKANLELKKSIEKRIEAKKRRIK